MGIDFEDAFDDDEEEGRSAGCLLCLGFVVALLVSGCFTIREARYWIFGRTATATVTRVQPPKPNDDSDGVFGSAIPSLIHRRTPRGRRGIRWGPRGGRLRKRFPCGTSPGLRALRELQEMRAAGPSGPLRSLHSVPWPFSVMRMSRRDVPWHPTGRACDSSTSQKAPLDCGLITTINSCPPMMEPRRLRRGWSLLVVLPAGTKFQQPPRWP